MATHEFGLLPQDPAGRRYDAYEPQKYGCIALEDALLEPLLPELAGILCYWHTCAAPARELAYCGITLIPPQSAGEYAAVFRRRTEAPYRKLADLFGRAAREGRYVIHYGI